MTDEAFVFWNRAYPTEAVEYRGFAPPAAIPSSDKLRLCIIMAFLTAFARKSLALMGAGLAILIVLAISSFLLVSLTAENAEQAATERAVRVAAMNIRTTVVDAETSQRGFLLTGKETYLEPFERAKTRIGEDLKALKETTAAMPELSGDAAKIVKLVEVKMRELERTLDLAKSGRRDDALALVNSDEGLRYMDELRDTLKIVIDRAELRVRGSMAGVEHSAVRLLWSTGLGGLLIIAFAGYAFHLVADNTKNLHKARQELETLNQDLESRVVERTTALTRANEEIQRFAYIVSHDLRAPLVNVMGFTTELESATAALKAYFQTPAPSPETVAAAKLATDEDIPELLKFIRNSTSKMDKLIGAILKLSREGRRDLKLERLNLAEVIDGAANSLRHQVETAEAKIEIARPLPTVMADRLAVEQIFGNILDNAVKYLSNGRPGRIEVTGEARNGRARIMIADNGRGIDARDLERVFELFRRAGEQDRPGEGVGLAHVRALTRRMGGDVTVTSRLGEGTTFCVELPKRATIRD